MGAEDRLTFAKSLRLRSGISFSVPESEEIRPRSVKRVKSRFSQLTSLDCFPEILTRIKRGDSLMGIASWIVEGGEFEKLHVGTPESLRHLLRAFKKTIPPMEIAAGDKITKEAAGKLKGGINELEELEELYHIQRERIKIDFDLEKTVKKLFKTTGKEVDIAKNILRTMIVQKLDMGIIQKQMTRIGVEHTVVGEMITSYGRVSVDKVLTDPSSRKKLLGIAERLMSSGANIEKLFEKLKALPAPSDAEETTGEVVKDDLPEMEPEVEDEREVTEKSDDESVADKGEDERLVAGFTKSEKKKIEDVVDKAMRDEDE